MILDSECAFQVPLLESGPYDFEDLRWWLRAAKVSFETTGAFMPMLGAGFKDFLFSPLAGEMIQVD